MNNAFGIAVTAILALSFAEASLFCPHLNVPGKNEAFGTVKILGKKANVDTPIYQLVDAGEPELNAVNKAEVFRLLTRDDLAECGGRGCVVEMTESSPKSHNTMMYGTNLLGNFYPPGFYRTEKSVRYYCALILGDCGSAVPIYRYYKWGMGGLFYAYSTDDSVEIPGFVLEPMPLCYGWDLPEVEEGSGTSAESIEEATIKLVKEDCSSTAAPTAGSLKELQVYFNEQPGALKDHYYTTKKPSLAELNDEKNDFYGYRLMDDEIGMVVVDEQKSNCSCLTRLVQMKDEKLDGLMPHKDHALISDASDIDPQGGVQYDPLPEDVYCASKQGACGATVPLRKYFNIFDLDTTYTINSTAPAAMSMSTAPVLCWIWPVDDATRAAKIAATSTTTTTPAPTTATEAVTNATEAVTIPETANDAVETTVTTSTPATTTTTVKATTTTTAKATTTTAKPAKKTEKNDAKKKEKKTTLAPSTTEKATTVTSTEASTTSASTEEPTSTKAAEVTEVTTTVKETETPTTTVKATTSTQTDAQSTTTATSTTTKKTA